MTYCNYYAYLEFYLNVIYRQIKMAVLETLSHLPYLSFAVNSQPFETSLFSF